ncbi:MAG: VIT and VWA domain-containing protein [bacterium]
MTIAIVVFLAATLLAFAGGIALAARSRNWRWVALATGGVITMWFAFFVVAAIAIDRLEYDGANETEWSSPARGAVTAARDTWNGEAAAEVLLPDGSWAQLPSVRASYNATVVGDLADVSLEQVFFNPNDQPVDANYVFPLHDESAVYAMEYVVADETVTATIQRRAEAQQTFDEAKSEGKSAALVVQQRPNVFSQSIANIPANSSVTVRLRYVHHAERRDGEYVLHIPTRVGPRYTPDMSKNQLGGQVFGAVPETIPASDLQIRGTVSPGLALKTYGSATHSIQTRPLGVAGVSFETKGSVKNEDFEFRWKLADDLPAASVTTTYDAATDTTFFSALVEPPLHVAPEQVSSREIVFLLDCSGSMMGDPIEASRAFMHQALDQLRPDDTFRVIRFSDLPTEFTQTPLIANPENVQRGHAYVDSLESQGGTEMTSGIRQALQTPPGEGRLRIVVFLTDGYIGNDFEVITLVDQLRGEARVYAIGVGGSVNRFLLDEVASMGQGHAAYLTDGPGAVAQARSLAMRIATPALTNLVLELPQANVLDQYPAQLPDLFEGQSVRAIGRIDGRWTGQAHVVGVSRNEAIGIATDTVPSTDEARLVGRTWARKRVGALTHELMRSEPSRPQTEIVEEATQIGLGWSLVTQWTSFVAVSNKPVERKPANQAWFEADVHGTPEPTTLLGLLLAGGAAFASRRRKNDAG